ncbi:MAG: helix-turn-helix domain-containing protein [Pseudonocardiaceae bacterium]
MPGDVRLGAVLRELRTARDLTLAAVSRQARCALSLVSYIESGERALQPWLARELDRIYATGTVVASLARGSGGAPEGNLVSGVPTRDVFVVLLPQGGAAMPLSRREVLAALGLGIASGELQGEFERALDGIELNGDVLQSLDDAFRGFQETARMLSPAQLIDGVTGNVAILDGLRRRVVAGEDRNRCGALQARYAELLSWLSEEAGDLPGAMWWNDRASQWAQAAGWPGMTVYGFVRRAMMIGRSSNEGLRVIDQVRPVLEMPQASLRMKGWAANEMALGYALAGNRDESRRALDTAIGWLTQPVRDDDAALQRTVAIDDLLEVYQATCDIYLGYGARVIPVLEPRMQSLTGSLRTATITRAKLARAYANAGQPEEACRVAWDTLDAIERIDSQSARNELRRAVPVLNQWHGRSDVQEVVHRLGT